MTTAELRGYFEDFNFEYKGKVLTWYSGDNEKNYKEKGNLYKPNDFVYKFNSHGFRSDEFIDGKNNIAYLGASITEGIGLPIEETWSYKLHQKIGDGQPYYNLAKFATGLDFCARVLFNYALRLKLKKVFVLCPDLCRRHYCYESEILDFTPGGKVIHPLFLDESYSWFKAQESIALMIASANYFGFDLYFQAFERKSLMLLGSLPKMPKLHVMGDIDFLDYQEAKNDFARDMMHPGKKFHNHVFSRMLSQLVD